MEKILIYLSIINNGDWNKIYKDVSEKRKVNCDEVEQLVNSLDCSFITLIDTKYPDCLKKIYKPPFVLFYKGDIDLLCNKQKKIAVIGSRENSEYGRKATNDICNGLVKESVIIVSGLAKGIDSITHKSCLQYGGKTIAVLGGGFDNIYPKANESLCDEIANKGLVISEYPPSTKAIGDNFLKRNRIIAGISDGVAVMEANIKSGTMNTVSHALENGKPIFCIPTAYDKNSGCNNLIKEGAKLIECIKDILDEL